MQTKERKTLEDIETMLAQDIPWPAIAKKYKRTIAGIRYYYASLRKKHIQSQRHEKSI